MPSHFYNPNYFKRGYDGHPERVCKKPWNPSLEPYPNPGSTPRGSDPNIGKPPHNHSAPRRNIGAGSSSYSGVIDSICNVFKGRDSPIGVGSGFCQRPETSSSPIGT
ncbi:hypothetical protein JTB14_024675 [Gonioctena quinquepunctata]|nr:hypothetical protein JTB14_024675 [Gonioctena quinquepunctata]